MSAARTIRKGVNWYLWRPALAEATRADIRQVREVWTLPDLYESHLVLDHLDELRRLAELQAEQERATAAAKGAR